MAQNVIENAVRGSFGAVNINYPTFPSIFQSTIGSGNVDIFTCPAGKRAAIYSVVAFNTAGTSTTWSMALKVGATYYRMSINSTTGTLAATSVIASPSIILEPGETFSIVTTQAGLNVWSRVLLFDVNNGLKTVKLIGPTTGNNTVYTVPAGKTAFLLGRNLDINENAGAGGAVMASSGAVGTTLDWKLVPSAGSPGTSNSFITSSIAANSINAAGSPKSMNSGDFMSVAVGTGDAAQVVWVNVMEI